MNEHKTISLLSFVSSLAFAGCTVELDEVPAAVADTDPSSEGFGHADAPIPADGDFRQLSNLAPPVCSQVPASSMTGVGSYTRHAGETRLTAPDSLLVFWVDPMAAGRWEFRVVARAYYVGSTWPSMRFWKGSQLLGEVDVQLSGHFETYTFEFDNPTDVGAVPFLIEFEGVAGDKPLAIAGVDIVCPGISCGDSVCTGEDVCCSHNPTGELACLDETTCPFTSQAQLTQITCDSHADCGDGNMCIGARFGNAEFAITCIDEDDYAPVSGGAIMYPVCGSPGREDDPCPAGLTCGTEAGAAGIRVCR